MFVGFIFLCQLFDKVLQTCMSFLDFFVDDRVFTKFCLVGFEFVSTKDCSFEEAERCEITLINFSYELMESYNFV